MLTFTTVPMPDANRWGDAVFAFVLLSAIFIFFVVVVLKDKNKIGSTEIVLEIVKVD